ncbi:Tripartite tricarboxylate transporter TctB family protein [Thiothrix eikelboomii]|uniref:Tripartite tricarboxylate transporter TctB family protein n=1 Tax=Thiothrix eikelboomii TaxID=92487 RepID=A0A1T4W2R6_9GAMM|nr:tripartite tricarboxylate transporter TctB family protein [Thiothrix eikelboomii]SKA71513.1 Tripartite tricarboxylate transporter TctB family protein [Thiothrix eikelboomii]
MDATPRKPGETGFNILLLLGSIFLFYQAYKIAGFSALSSPGAIPMAASAIMVITTCIIVVKEFARPKAEGGAKAFFTQILPFTIAVMCGLIILFAVVLQQLGFVLTGLAFLWVSIWFLQKRSPLSAALIALLCVFVIYVLFRLIFQVILPEGIIPERDIIASVKNFFAGAK